MNNHLFSADFIDNNLQTLQTQMALITKIPSELNCNLFQDERKYMSMLVDCTVCISKNGYAIESTKWMPEPEK